MAAPVRRTDPSLVEILLYSPWEFDFFQAVRVLPWVYPVLRVRSGTEEPNVISEFEQSFDEAARFRAHVSLLFPASEIQAIEPEDSNGGRFNMTVNFMGLTGPQGILPAHYTEYLVTRSLANDWAAAGFFDLFNHRLISLFYLAWEKHHFPVAVERALLRKGDSGRFTQYLRDLIGMGTPHLSGTLSIDETALLGYAGLIAQRPHSAVALAGLLRDYFQVGIEIVQFIGKWCPLEQEKLSYLGGEASPNQLGFGAIAGDEVWNQQARFRVRIGPLNWDRYNEFLPTGSAGKGLVELVRYFVDRACDFEVQLVLNADEVPLCSISGNTDSPRLGQSTWLKTEAFEHDARDLVMTAGAGGLLG